MKSIEENVKKALHGKVITPSMEVEISELCGNKQQLSLTENQAIDQLMNALLMGEVTIFPTKRFINVMEDLVLLEAIAYMGEVEHDSEHILDLGDITAYALNRLPPLYATTQEGARFQCTHARRSLRKLITNQVQEAIIHNMVRPTYCKDRQNVTKDDDLAQVSIFKQISVLLDKVAPELSPTSSQKLIPIVEA